MIENIKNMYINYELVKFIQKTAQIVQVNTC